jgi:small-conductance mechanosensitive channel
MVADYLPFFSFKGWVIAGNTALDYLWAGLIFTGLLLVFKFGQRLVLEAADKITRNTKTEVDNALVEVVKTIRPPFYVFVAFWAALHFLEIIGMAARIIDVVLLIWVVYLTVRAVHILADALVRRRMRGAAGESAEAATQIVHSFVGAALWVLGVLFVLQNLGVQVTSLVAGLGISGIAVALAAQNILGDLFSALAIYFDKPFAPGDVIEFAQDRGVVKKIGIKTTRLTSWNGEEMIVPNRELANARIRNYGRLTRRRVSFPLKIAAATPLEKIKQVPELVRQAVAEREDVYFLSCYLGSLAGSGDVYDVIYLARGGTMKMQKEAQQEILLSIKEKLSLADIALV